MHLKIIAIKIILLEFLLCLYSWCASGSSISRPLMWVAVNIVAVVLLLLLLMLFFFSSRCFCCFDCCCYNCFCCWCCCCLCCCCCGWCYCCCFWLFFVRSVSCCPRLFLSSYRCDSRLNTDLLRFCYCSAASR